MLGDDDDGYDDYTQPYLGSAQADLIKRGLEQLDLDLKQLVVLSGLSLNKIKLDKAFSLACQVVQIRAELKKPLSKAEAKMSEATHRILYEAYRDPNEVAN